MLPYKFQPRDYQIPLLRAIDNGYTRALCVWHRRAGKDKTLINLVAKKMVEKVGTYFYFFPTYRQGKKILWNGMDKDGMRFLEHIPNELRKRTDNGEMLIELKNGSIFQIIGTDNVDSIVGTNPIGCIFSEYSLQDPIAWGYIRPILAENGGWAIFNYTSRGKNHGFSLYQYAKENTKEWFVQVLTAEQTGIFTREQLAGEREQYILEDGDDLRFLQEYYCSFEGSVQGSYYGKLLEQAEKESRVTSVPYDANVPVDTWWDLGVGDAMAIWCTQIVGHEIHVIDYIEKQGEGVPYYINELKSRNYVFGKHYWPHDGEARELTTGVSRNETAVKLGLAPIEIVAKLGIDDGISAVRQILSRCWFDAKRCERGLDCLRQYHKEYDEKNKVYKDTPKHDWSSHGADGFRTFAVGFGQFKSTTTVPLRKKTYIPMTQYGG